MEACDHYPPIRCGQACQWRICTAGHPEYTELDEAKAVTPYLLSTAPNTAVPLQC